MSSKRRGIVLAGGSGTRLYPATIAVSKQLLPVYDKPMIYYPLSILILAGIQDILLISTPQDLPLFKSLLKDGSHFGVNMQYAEQAKPDGLAQAFVIGESFLQGSPATLVLGDNLFYGHGLPELLRPAGERQEGATVFGYRVRDPERYGVMELAEDGKVVGIVEKPEHPKSNYAVVGLYYYDSDVCQMAKTLRPSLRGEYEITDLNNLYLQKGRLYAELMGRGFAWLDTGTHDSLIEASCFIQAIEQRQGLKVACLEEIAWQMGYISDEQVAKSAYSMRNTGYGQHLMNILAQRTK